MIPRDCSIVQLKQLQKEVNSNYSRTSKKRPTYIEQPVKY